MAQKKALETPTQFLEKTRVDLNRIQKIRRSILCNMLAFVLPLAVSFLLVTGMMEEGLATYFQTPLENHLHYDLYSLLIAAVFYFLFCSIMLLLEINAAHQLENTQIELEYDPEPDDPQVQSERMCHRYQEAYYDTVFRYAQQAHSISHAMSILGPLVLLAGIILSLFQDMKPAWLPCVYAIVVDMMLLLHRFYYSNAMRFVRDDHAHFVKTENIEHAIRLINEQQDEKERAVLMRMVVESLLNERVVNAEETSNAEKTQKEGGSKKLDANLMKKAKSN